MNLEKIKKALFAGGVNNSNTEKFAKYFLDGFLKYKINDFDAQINFIANAIHESGKLTTFEENLNYSAESLVKVFPSRITKEQAELLGYKKDFKGNYVQYANKKGIADLVYGNRNGNSSTEGFLYRGRGIFQLTFKSNYQKFKDFSGIDVISNPDLVATDLKTAVESALWFYTSNLIDRIKDPTAVRKKINGGTNGLDDVLSITKKIKSEINGK